MNTAVRHSLTELTVLRNADSFGGIYTLARNANLRMWKLPFHVAQEYRDAENVHVS